MVMLTSLGSASAEPGPEWRCLGVTLQPQGEGDQGSAGTRVGLLQARAPCTSGSKQPGGFEQATLPETVSSSTK